MMNRNLLLTLACLAAAGCASSTNKALDQKLSEQPAPANRREVLSKADQRIADSKDLSEDQRKRLTILRDQVTSQIDDINKQSLKLRSVLVEEILSPNYDLDEVNLIKRRLKKLEDKRLSLMFDGVDQANTILGRQALEHRNMMREMLQQRAIREEE